MAYSTSPRPEALLAHAEWVRSLARCLVSDPQRAEDLAQDAWVSALESPRVQVMNMRGWLAQILRNLVRQDHRASGRRDRRERNAARPERVASTGDLVERVSSHRVVVEAVLNLNEPYRTAVLMRFFEGMPPRKIAQELKLPVSTVHTQIQRGLKMLRSRLDGLHGGDRRSWVFALLPLANQKGGAGAALIGALVMKTKLQILVGVMVVAIGLVATWPLITGSSGEPAQAGGPSTTPAPMVAAERAEPRVAEEFSRNRIPEVLVAPEESTITKAPAIPIRGRVVDSEAQPLVGMALRFGDDEEPVATAGVQGEFQFVTEGGAGQIVVARQGWTTVMAAVVNPLRPPAHALVVAALAVNLGGRVVDEFGTPVPGAAVALALPAGFRARFTENTDASSNRRWQTRTGEDGSFRLDQTARVSGAELIASNPGFEDESRPLPQQDDLGLEFVLRRTERADDTVSGQVIDEDGVVVEGAWIAIGASSTRSDEQGEFTLKLATEGPMDQMMQDLGATVRILAVKEGYRPARLDQPTDALGQRVSWPSTVVLRLQGAPLTIGSQVVDEEGEPLPEARVWVNDPTFFGSAGRGIATLEGVMGGASQRWDFVVTDDQGRFQLSGLADRDYHLRAIVSTDILMVDVGPVRAGRQDVLIQVPVDAYYDTVAGQVLSQSGLPVSGVSVVPQGDAFSMRVGGQPVSTSHASGQGTRTDAQGRFELKHMPRTDIYLRLDGEEILPFEYGRGVEGGIEALSGGAVQSLRIHVSVRVHVQVELDDPESADQFRVLDIQGQQLPINVFTGTGRRTTRMLQLVDGRSPVMVLPEDANTMVFLKGGQEVKTINLGLIPGEINRIRW